MNLYFFKKKVFLIPFIVFILLVVLIGSMDTEDELEEIESKFPLEDYLFKDSLKKELANTERKREEEEQQKNFLEIEESLKKMQQQMQEQQNIIEKNKLMEGLVDKEGNPIVLDSDGNLLMYDENGKRVFLDENGKPYTLDENGNKVYIGSDDKIFNSSGVEIERDSENRPIFYDKDGNQVSVAGNKKTTTYKDASKLIEDSKGNYQKIDKEGKITESGIKSPFADEKAKQESQQGDSHTQGSDSNTNNNTTYTQGAQGDKTQTKNPNLFYDENGNLIGDSVAIENQKFDNSKASPLQRNINNLLAQRFEMPQENSKKPSIEYGVDEFSNLDNKDEGSNEHKLLRTITADRMIPAFLVRPISSQIAGNVVAQVETNIYGHMGRAVLIPKGSRVIGFYQNNNKIGEYRLNIIWTRIITPQGINILLTDAKGADVKGYNGLVGEVHSRNFERYGIPITLSTLSNGLLLAVNSLNDSASANQTNALASAYMQSQILSGMRQDVSTIIQRIIQEQIKIQPLITIREGSRIFIAPSMDIFIPIPKNGETLARFFKESKSQQEEETNEEDS